MSEINQAIPVMSAVADSMIGITQPIKAEGPTSAIGRIVSRMCDGNASPREVQTSSRELFDMGILTVNDGTLGLNVHAARTLVREMLLRVDHPAYTEHPLRDLVHALMDRLTAALTGFPTVTTFAAAPAS